MTSRDEYWSETFKDAKGKWRAKSERSNEVTYAEAEAGTGSRYAVVVSTLGPEAQATLGGSKLVSVMYPWKAVYPVASGADGLHETYIYEKFGRDGRIPEFGGDAAALILTVRYALMVHDGQLQPGQAVAVEVE